MFKTVKLRSVIIISYNKLNLGNKAPSKDKEDYQEYNFKKEELETLIKNV